MNLRDIAHLIGADAGSVDAEVDVTDLAYDSRSATAGSLFFCVRGATVDGHDHAEEAFRRGAVAVVCERPVGAPVPQLHVKDSRLAMAALAAPFFGYPSRSLDLVGITGTNGKTTTAFFLEAIFAVQGNATGLISTVVTRFANHETPGRRTTPEAIDLQRLLRSMVDEGVSRCVMEVTSIGLVRGRIEGTIYKSAVFTNLSQDHLDYHGDMEHYFLAKRELFSPQRSEAAVVNIDDPYGGRIVSEISLPTLTFGLDTRADLTAVDIDLNAGGSVFTVQGPGLRARMQIKIGGIFNVQNALAAIGAAHQLGVEIEVIAAGIERVERIPGRLEPIDAGQGFSVMVDYAHTPGGLERVLGAARQMAGPNKVIAVFGCGGDRDRGKRRLMGLAAARNADLVVATSDNPRSEDPEQILREVEKGLIEGTSSSGYEIVVDRRDAIDEALRRAGPGDVVVIAGKGHETVQEFNGKTIPFDDRTVVAEALRKIK